MFVERACKDSLLIHLLKTHPEWTKVIVFAKMNNRKRHGHKSFMDRRQGDFGKKP